MDRLNNYNEYDKLVLYVKDKKTKKIIDYYTSLGWELISSVCNHKYRNIMDLTFVRPHIIDNKDELQLLQVKLESKLNDIEKLSKKKYSKTLLLGLTFSIFGVISIILSIIQIHNSVLKLDKLLSVVLLIIGILSFITLYFFMPKIYIKEKIIFEQEYKKLNNELVTISKSINLIRSKKYGKN